MAQITIFTAAITLQDPEVRSKLTNEFANLYHDLDGGFSPINWVAPNFPFPHNIRRDRAQLRMRKIYEDIIAKRRAGKVPQSADMISHLMTCSYKAGHAVPDKEIANICITILTAGQHNSSNIASWIMLHLANEPRICEELYQEQLDQLGGKEGLLRELTLQDMDKLPLHAGVFKETLHMHNAIHSIMRLVKKPLPVPNTEYIIPPGHAYLASPGVSANSEEYFPNPTTWDPHRWDHRDVEEDGGGEMVDYGYGRMSKGTKSAYLPFGGGRHRCIGESFAYLNISVITAVMARNFRFGNVEGREGVPGTDYSTMFSRPMQPAEICWERRSKDARR
ncbi:cytochrome P450 like protein [Zymoseptoria brevis]|uniref:Cytochrome P450 like protein n=1 Tax=Zymoseptoria brevis TaxID=1047168 RepID=A0A0F4G4I9_9PEZI|nr:cytochrome P450 like protein [Zymoseptoria brevis]